jgi:hypothetical protein
MSLQKNTTVADRVSAENNCPLTQEGFNSAISEMAEMKSQMTVQDFIAVMVGKKAECWTNLEQAVTDACERAAPESGV